MLSRRLMRLLNTFAFMALCLAAWLYPACIPEASASNQLTRVYKPVSLSGCGGTLLPPQDTSVENEIIHLVNQERASRNLPPLKLVDALANSARYHATDLGEDDYFNHDSYDRSDGELVYTCNTWERIATFYDGGRGENIAAGYTSPAAVMEAWMESDGHRANILSTSHWELGVGYWRGSGTYGYYYAQNFGRQAGVYPLVINLDEPTTSQQEVQIYIYGDWTEMRLRNDDQPWSDWLPFQAWSTWELPNTLGVHTINAEMQNRSMSAASQDQIELTAFETAAELANLPDAVTFLYSQTSQAWLSNEIILYPQNGAGTDLIAWEVSVSAPWLIVSPASGETPAGFNLAPDIDPATLHMPISATVTISALSPAEIEGSPHQIIVTLEPSTAVFYTLFLPTIQR